MWLASRDSAPTRPSFLTCPHYRSCRILFSRSGRPPNFSSVFVLLASSQDTFIKGSKFPFEPPLVSTLYNIWLASRDSNPDRQLQKLLCYHYTTRQQKSLFTVTTLCPARLPVQFFPRPFQGSCFHWKYLLPHH